MMKSARISKCSAFLAKKEIGQLVEQAGLALECCGEDARNIMAPPPHI